MDPNANLIEQERLLHYVEHSLIQTASQVRHRKARLQELRTALCEWLQDGGFAPDWTLVGPAASKYYRQKGYQS